jgi:hypothetical protein
MAFRILTCYSKQERRAVKPSHARRIRLPLPLLLPGL